MTTIKPEILDELLAGVSSPEELMGDAGLFRQLKKALMERALGGELTHHLGYEKHDPGGRGSGNSRNGHSQRRHPTRCAHVSVETRAIWEALSKCEGASPKPRRRPMSSSSCIGSAARDWRVSAVRMT